MPNNTTFDSKVFNPEVFGAYVDRIPNTTKAELARSRAIGRNEQAAAALRSQTGSFYAKVPYFGRISGATSQNNDGNTDITSTSTTTFTQGFVVASRMDSWTERSFSKNITAGVDFMDNVAAQISDYKMEVKQGIVLAMLKGIFAMSTAGATTAAKAAKEFVEKHTYDVTAKAAGLNCVGASTLNSAIQQACGDNKSAFSLVFMHSTVATNLENLKLLKFLTYTDSDGITRDLNLGSWNGKLVLIDDGMPTENGYYSALETDEGALKVVSDSPEAGQIKLADVQKGAFYPAGVAADQYVVEGTKFTSYALGVGSVVVDDIGDSNPYEMSREPAKNGGQDTLYVRDRYVLGVDGLSFKEPSNMVSVSNADLEKGANWEVINDGTIAIPHKAIAVSRIISRG